MDRSDLKFVWGVTAVLIILTSVPFLYGYLIRPPETIFTGNGFFNAIDLPVYYSYLEQAKSGRWLFLDLFTSEPGQKPFLHLFWLLLGKSAAIFNLNAALAFHLSRLLLIPIFVWTVYKFLRLVFGAEAGSAGKIRLAIFLFFFTAGGGALVSFFRVLPFENWWPEAYGFFSAYYSPHFIASWTLLIASFYFLLGGYLAGSWKKIVWAGLAAAVLGQFQPFLLALFFSIPLIFLIFQFRDEKISGGKKIFKQTLVFYLFLFLPAAFYFHQFINNGTIWQRYYTALPTPDPPLVLFVFGVNSVLACAGLIRYRFSKEKNPVKNFSAGWLAIVPFLLYAPIPFQRRLIEGWQLPTIIFAAAILWDIAVWLKKNIRQLERRFLIALFFALLIVPPLTIWLASFSIYGQTVLKNDFYLPQETKTALLWLKNQKDGTVLSAASTGLWLAAFSQKTVFLGHHYETLRFQDKQKTIAWFFRGNGQDELKTKFLRQEQIKYLIWGKEERGLGDFQPEEKEYLELIYQNPEIKIFAARL